METCTCKHATQHRLVIHRTMFWNFGSMTARLASIWTISLRVRRSKTEATRQIPEFSLSLCDKLYSIPQHIRRWQQNNPRVFVQLVRRCSRHSFNRQLYPSLTKLINAKLLEDNSNTIQPWWINTITLDSRDMDFHQIHGEFSPKKGQHMQESLPKARVHTCRVATVLIIESQSELIFRHFGRKLSSTWHADQEFLSRLEQLSSHDVLRMSCEWRH